MPLKIPQNSKQTIIFLVGPTAVGKSNVAASLAKKIKAEIISCDSMQLYKGMKILSSRPNSRMLKAVKHYLIATVLPTREYNVSAYRREAMRAIKEITKKKRVVLFVGGTGLYMSILIDGIFKVKAHSQLLRNRLYAQANKIGSGALHRKLEVVDPAAAAKIHPNDTRRIVRALEVFKLTGKPISELQKQRKGLIDEYNLKLFCLDMPRKDLYRRIDERVDKMFKAGLIAEAKKLLKNKISKTASYAIGIRELKGYFDGEYDLNHAKELIKRNTRLYAKRQLTWFRKDKRINWIQISDKQTAAGVAAILWKKLY